MLIFLDKLGGLIFCHYKALLFTENILKLEVANVVTTKLTAFSFSANALTVLKLDPVAPTSIVKLGDETHQKKSSNVLNLQYYD